MSGSSAGSYTELLRRPAVARTFVPALVGRLAYGVLPLSLLFTVQHASGSFSVAASAMALNGLASLTMPLKARAIDRHGQRPVIPLITAAMVTVLVAAAAMARSGISDPLPWLAAGSAVGLASPPFGPSMRAQWRALVPDDAIGSAYSLDAVGEETLYLVGPMIAAGLLAVAPTYAGLLVCAALLVVGAAGLAASPAATASAGPGDRRMARGPLRHTRWGRLRHHLPMRLTLALLLAALGTATLLASAAEPFWWFAAVLAVGGLAISPLYVVAYRASDTLVERAEATEASTWVSTVNNLGISAGSALSGLLVSHLGAHAPGWVGGALALAVACYLTIRRSTPNGSSVVAPSKAKPWRS